MFERLIHLANFPNVDVSIKDFQERLRVAEFLPIDSDSTQWEGTLHIEWVIPESGEWQSSDHKIAIFLPIGFPYRSPIVQSLDTPKIEGSLHIAPLGILCLWREPGGWNPFMSGQKFLSRIHEWFTYYHQGNWPEDFAPTDLHLYLPNDGLIVIGEEWMPNKDQQVGNFVLWRNSKNHDRPCLVALKTDQYKIPNQEKRLVDALLWNDEHPERYHGVWFRVLKPFVPDTHLDVLLKQIDQANGNEEGESLSQLSSSLSHFSLTKDIPIAIGYPGSNDQEYWLFLCAKKPAGKKLQFANLPHRKMIEIHSFQIAPARKLDIIRRTIHTSRILDDKKVVLFGVGSLGSSIALLLAKAGLGNLSLVDSDDIYPANVIRHQVGMNFTGFRKTAIMQIEIRSHNPDCVVNISDEIWETEKILEVVKDADVLIDATANTSFSLWLNQIAVENSVPILFATTYRRASIGRLIFHRENQDPCLACYSLSEKKWSEDLFPIIPPDHNLIFGEEGCASVTQEADAINIETIACLTSKVIVEHLSENKAANLFLLVNDPLDDGAEMLSSVGLHKLTNHAVENCPICGYIEKTS